MRSNLYRLYLPNDEVIDCVKSDRLNSLFVGAPIVPGAPFVPVVDVGGLKIAVNVSHITSIEEIEVDNGG